LSEVVLDVIVYRKPNGEWVEIGWKFPKNIVCVLCHKQGKLTCCKTHRLLVKHILRDHPELLNRKVMVTA